MKLVVSLFFFDYPKKEGGNSKKNKILAKITVKQGGI
jgi:hypothetical protein